MVQKNQLNVIKHIQKSTITSVPHTCDTVDISGYTQLDQSQTQIVQKFVRLCMKNGQKTKSHFIMAKTLTQIGFYADIQMGSMDHKVNLLPNKMDHKVNLLPSKMDSIRFLMKAVDNVKPVLEVTKMRIAGSTQFVPKMIPQNRQESLAIRWLIQAAQSQKRRHATKKTGQILHRLDGSQSEPFAKQNQSFLRRAPDLSDFLVIELIDAFNKVGSVKQKRDELHQLAEANRGFSHYRWW